MDAQGSRTRLTPMRFIVTCSGEMSPAAIANVEAEGIDVQVGASVGAAVAPGAPIPDRRTRYHLRVDADDAVSAVRRSEAVVLSAGGRCSQFDAEQEPRSASRL